MELSEIFKLIDAGYTKADIEALSGTKPEETPQTEENSVEETTQAEDTPVSEVEELKKEIESLKAQLATKETPKEQPNDAILSEIKKMRESIQAHNIRETSQPKVQTADDILASMIQ